MDAAMISAIGGVVVLVIGAIAAAVVRVVQTKADLLVAGQQAQGAQSKVRDNKIQEIHLLVNSRLLTVLKLLVVVTKKEALRTGDPADIEAFEEAQAELTKAEASAQTVSQLVNRDSKADEAAAVVATDKLIKLSVKAGRALPVEEPVVPDPEEVRGTQDALAAIVATAKNTETIAANTKKE